MVKNYSSAAVAAVEESIEMFDVKSMVEHAFDYVSIFHYGVMEYVLENIEDSEEFNREEIEYLSERVSGFIDEIL